MEPTAMEPAAMEPEADAPDSSRFGSPPLPDNTGFRPRLCASRKWDVTSRALCQTAALMHARHVCAERMDGDYARLCRQRTLAAKARTWVVNGWHPEGLMFCWVHR